jgi:polyribonucleotide nucleotidyltransferase
MFAEDEAITENQAMAQLKSLEKDIVRTAILKDKKRIDGRGLADVRQIKCEVGVLPRTHWFRSFYKRRDTSFSSNNIRYD